MSLGTLVAHALALSLVCPSNSGDVGVASSDAALALLHCARRLGVRILAQVAHFTLLCYDTLTIICVVHSRLAISVLSLIIDCWSQAAAGLLAAALDANRPDVADRTLVQLLVLLGDSINGTAGNASATAASTSSTSTSNVNSTGGVSFGQSGSGGVPLSASMRGSNAVADAIIDAELYRSTLAYAGTCLSVVSCSVRSVVDHQHVVTNALMLLSWRLRYCF
jgi:hypothetical protein